MTSGLQQSFAIIKKLGDGSFASVFLCEWQGSLSPEVPLMPVSSMSIRTAAEQSCVSLVAIKKLKRKWEYGCEELKELKALRAIAPHPCIVSFHNAFLARETSELCIVFEVMEGNLAQFMKCRKQRPFSTGLLAYIFWQITTGLHHIHTSGYFHRDLKPENVLITTTGLFDYVSPLSQSLLGTVEQNDVAVICKIADFDSAKEISSTPPYTEYVSARWYRAPEVLLHQRDYSTPVDMWALGAMMAEMVNFRPIFPGSGIIDQINRIVKVLGNPADYGVDERGRPRGGGPWPRGLEQARNLAFTFPETEPRDICVIFGEKTPRRLAECISDLLRFDPNLRLTSQQCFVHEYLKECLPVNLPHILLAKLRAQQSLMSQDSQLLNVQPELTIDM